MRLRFAAASAVILLFTLPADAADLVRLVRLKLSAGDLPSSVAYVDDYRRETGVDAEYLNAVGWLARGAVMLGRPDLASLYVAELREEIPAEKEEVLIPYGAAIEVESKLRLAKEGRGAAIRFLEEELARAKDIALRSRIRKNINLLSLEGQPAPPAGELELRGRPTLLFLWANWCGDCKSQEPVLGRILERYRERGLQIIAPTRLYGTVDGKPASADDEKAHVAKVWKETYGSLADVSVVIDTETMVRYGASATPTFVLVDRAGIVRLYSPTRLSEPELARRIEAVLAE
jgi:thiol-disulfide isomerase/thioredoxin